MNNVTPLAELEMALLQWEQKIRKLVNWNIVWPDIELTTSVKYKHALFM